MLFQQNVISSEAPAKAIQTRIRFHRAILVMLMIAGITLLLSLYVYQVSVNYAIRMQIEAKKLEYAREQRLLAAKLQMLGETNNIEAMVRRARASGYGPPSPSQIRYVREDDGSVFVQSDLIPTITARR
ncbi:MAG TPA: hypothetical protein EYP25_05595 [Anaerolineae bacterium]|nr:hypothetical protein [Anaerolineae bacterium]